MMKLTRMVVVLVLAVGLAACSSTDVAEQTSGTSDPSGAPGTTVPLEPVRGGSLVVGTSGEVDGMSPLASQWSGPAYQMGRAVLDPLVVMDTEGRWQPYLAKSIVPNAEFTVWTFELRPGVMFHNGEALDAAALAMFFEAAVSSPLSSQGFPEKPTVATPSSSTVTLTFTRPWSNMPAALTEQIGYVIAPEQLRSGDTKHPIGTGPFVFEEWVPGDHFRATRNESYWQAGLPYLDRIEFRPIADPTARFAALEAGDLDAAEANSQGDSTLDELRDAGFTIVDDYDNVGVVNLLMNTERAPVDDLRVRQAIVAGIDREAFRDVTLDPSFEVADQPYPQGNLWHADVDYPSFDPDRARGLVDEYEAEHGPIAITIMGQANPRANQSAQFLQQQLASVGIDATVEDLELSAFVKRFVSGDYDTVFLGGFFGATDPDGNYPFVSAKGASPEALIKLNFARYVNPDVDAALEAQRATDDVAARQASWATIWKAFAADVPYAFLAYDQTAWATEPDVHGLEAPTTPEGVVLPAINRWTPFYTRVFRSE
jgi:peptide/nickel transport system substrate-binding protein